MRAQPLPGNVAIVEAGGQPSRFMSIQWQNLLDSLGTSDETNAFSISTRAVAITLEIPSDVTTLFIGGYSAAGDKGGGIYKRVAAAPSHAGYFQSADGAYWELSEPVVNPRMFGAAGNGTTNDRTPVQRAIDFGLATGAIVDGLLLTYGIATNVFLKANTTLRNARFKDVNTGRAGRRTITSGSVDNITLTNVSVDLNGNGTQGDATTAGIYIAFGSNHKIERCEVFGNSRGHGMVFAYTADSAFTDLYVHDMTYDQPGATDDVVFGISFLNTTDSTIRSPRIERLFGNATGHSTRRFTRAMGMGGNVNFRLYDPYVDQCDQGVDVTGGPGNINFTIVGGVARRCLTWGWKFANAAEYGVITGAVGDSCGIAGFVCSAPASLPQPYVTGQLTFVNCISINTGIQDELISAACGFKILGDAGLGVPVGIKFVACNAIDYQTVPTMQYGFKNEVTGGVTPNAYIEAVNCSVTGAITKDYDRMNAASCLVTGSGTLAVASATSTAISFANTSFDYAEMHNGAPGDVTITQDGLYEIALSVWYAANGTGARFAQIVRNGSSVGFGRSRTGGVSATDSTNVLATCQITAVAGDVITAMTEQTSVGALNALLDDSYMSVKRIGDRIP